MERITSIAQIQELCLDILIAFDRFCRENDLRYSLAYGSLIGAVRHKGFVPWDDDIDVIMPRPDYDRLLAAPEKIGEHLSLRNYSNMDYPFFAYAKLEDNRTLLHEHIRIPNDLGVNIDIFPVDGLPARENEIKRHFRKAKRHDDLIQLSTMKIMKGRSKVGYLLKLLILPPIRLLFDAKRLVIRQDRLVREYDFEKSQFVAVQASSYGLREVIPRSYFDDYTELEFCGHRFKAITNYDTLLRQWYGDYMKLPREKERVSTHTYDAYFLS